MFVFDGYEPTIECRYITNLRDNGTAGYCVKIQQRVSTTAAGLAVINCPGCERDCRWKSVEPEEPEKKGESFVESAKKEVKREARMAKKVVVGTGRVTGKVIGATGKVVGMAISETIEEAKQHREEKKERREQKRQNKIEEAIYNASHYSVETKYARMGYTLGLSGIFCFLYVLMLEIIEAKVSNLFNGFQWIFILAFWIVLGMTGFMMTSDDYEVDTDMRNKSGMRQSIPGFVIALILLYIDYRYMRGAVSLGVKQILVRIVPEAILVFLAFLASKMMLEKNNADTRKAKKKKKGK